MLWTLRPSAPEDAAWIAELRAVVLHADLDRLGRFDPVRVRQRFLQAFDVEHTSVLVVDGADAGSVALRPDADGSLWLEHFYLDPSLQGRGIGSGVLDRLLRENGDRTFRLNVLQRSPARRLYERAGFVLDSADEVDIFMTRTPR